MPYMTGPRQLSGGHLHARESENLMADQSLRLGALPARLLVFMSEGRRSQVLMSVKAGDSNSIDVLTSKEHKQKQHHFSPCILSGHPIEGATHPGRKAFPLS